MKYLSNAYEIYLLGNRTLKKKMEDEKMKLYKKCKEKSFDFIKMFIFKVNNEVCRIE
jgi:hypothetical protein